MICAVAFVPEAPVLVSELSGAAQGELVDLVAAIDSATAVLRSTRPDRIRIVAGGTSSGVVPEGTAGTLAGYGNDVAVSLGPPVAGKAAGRSLPVGLLVGAYLLRAVTGCRIDAITIGPDDADVHTGDDVDSACAEPESERTALLVLGDGSARHGPKSPGSEHPGAAACDDRLAAALATGTWSALPGIDAETALEQQASCFRAWKFAGQLLSEGRALADNPSWQATLLYRSNPYGVGYLVATWLP